MEVLEKVLFQWDYNTFYSFFQDAQIESTEKNQSQVASISLEIDCVDPLTVLASIDGFKDFCFYFEHPENGFSIAGAEQILEEVFEGEERFKEVRDFTKKILKNTIVKQEEGVDVGPYFFTGFTFNDRVMNDPNEKGTFPAARVFLAAWQIVQKNLRFFVTFNQIIDSQTDIDCLSKKVWGKYLKVKSFNKGSDFFQNENKVQEQQSIEVGGNDWYEKALVCALEHIDSQDIEKIVIARAIEFEKAQSYSILNILNNLRKKYPQSFSCFIGNTEKSFICATPERLIKIENETVFTEALAGTSVRGKNEFEDDFLGNALLLNAKELNEHQFVVDSIVERLNSIGLKVEFNTKPILKKLVNIQHLYTPIKAKLNESIHILDLAEILHPTPAVCGKPLEVARKIINTLEPFDRGLYAGVLGFFDGAGEGELVVGIRSVHIEGKKARLYAGSGIVTGSKIESERNETDLKFQTILESLL